MNIQDKINFKTAEIGSGCIVAAGSVVTKSFGDNLVIGGIPAKIIKKID